MTSYLTPKIVAGLLVMDVEAVTDLIRRRELVAINVGRGKLKPRYRIDPADLERFLESRRTGPAPRPAGRRRAESKAGRVQYYPES